MRGRPHEKVTPSTVAHTTQATWVPTRLLDRASVSDLVGLVASCLIVVIAYSPILFFGKTLSAAGAGWPPGTNGWAPFPGQPSPTPDFRTDVAASTLQFEPWAEVTHRAYWEGEVPFWNPYQGGGAPHVANMQSAVFDPLLLGVKLSPTPLMWDLSLVAAFLLGAAAAYLFGRMLGLDVVPAVVSSGAFSLSGWFFLYSNNHFSRSYVFLPVLFLLVELVLRSRRFLPVLGLAVAVAANIYIGMPEASFFVIGAAAAYAAFRVVQVRTATAVRLSVVRLGGGAFLGLLLAAPLLLLFLEYEPLSFNLHKRQLARGTEADPAWGALHWIIPWFPGAPELPEPRPRNWIGVAVAISALVAVSGREETKRLRAWFFLVLGILVLAKIYDVGMLEWVGRLPAAESAIFPIYAAPVASFAFAVLAGIGVQVLWSRDLRAGRFFVLFGVLLTVLLATLAVSGRLGEIRAGPEKVWLGGALFAYLAVGAVLLSSRLGRKWAACLLAGVVLAELLWLAPLPSRTYPTRADPFVAPGWMPFVRAAQRDEPFSRVFALDGKLYPNTASALGLQDIRAVDALYVERYFRYVQAFIQPNVFDRFTGEEADPQYRGNPMFDVLGVSAVLAARDLKGSGLRLVGRDLDTRVYENTNAYPRAWVVHDVHVVDGEDDAFALLQARARRSDGAFDPRYEAVVESAEDTPGTPLLALQDGRADCEAGRLDDATIERYTSNSVTIGVRAACPGLLVLPDTYYPGWRATVDGRDQPLYPTNGAFRGVTVPAGTSQVEFRYEPRAFPVGIALAMGGLAVFAVLWIISGRRSGRRSVADPVSRSSPTSPSD